MTKMSLVNNTACPYFVCTTDFRFRRLFFVGESSDVLSSAGGSGRMQGMWMESCTATSDPRQRDSLAQWQPTRSNVQHVQTAYSDTSSLDTPPRAPCTAHRVALVSWRHEQLRCWHTTAGHYQRHSSPSSPSDKALPPTRPLKQVTVNMYATFTIVYIQGQIQAIQ